MALSLKEQREATQHFFVGRQWLHLPASSSQRSLLRQWTELKDVPVLFCEVACCPLQLQKEENCSFVNKAGSYPIQPEEITVPWRSLAFSLGWAKPFKGF